jgi:hypothetical protein
LSILFDIKLNKKAAEISSAARVLVLPDEIEEDAENDEKDELEATPKIHEEST